MDEHTRLFLFHGEVKRNNSSVLLFFFCFLFFRWRGSPFNTRATKPLSSSRDERRRGSGRGARI
jgi:hypothetical protein